MGRSKDWEEVLERYHDPRVWESRIVPGLHQFGATEIAIRAGVSPRWIRAILNDGAWATPHLRRKLSQVLIDLLAAAKSR